MDKAAIIKLHKEGRSNRWIAKELNISRSTVNKYVHRYEKDQKLLNESTDLVEIANIQQSMFSRDKMNVSNRHSRKFVEEVKDKFYEIIRINDERNKALGINKQQINSSIIYRELIRCEYEVGESTVRGWYQEYRNSLPKEVFIKQIYEYGDRVVVFVNLPIGSLDDFKSLCEDVTDKGHWRNGDYCLNIHRDDEIS